MRIELYSRKEKVMTKVLKAVKFTAACVMAAGSIVGSVLFTSGLFVIWHLLRCITDLDETVGTYTHDLMLSYEDFLDILGIEIQKWAKAHMTE